MSSILIHCRPQPRARDTALKPDDSRHLEAWGKPGKEHSMYTNVQSLWHREKGIGLACWRKDLASRSETAPFNILAFSQHPVRKKIPKGSGSALIPKQDLRR